MEKDRKRIELQLIEQLIKIKLGSDSYFAYKTSTHSPEIILSILQTKIKIGKFVKLWNTCYRKRNILIGYKCGKLLL